MDLHPVFVHFPIALLLAYAFLEIVRMPILRRQSWNLPTRAYLLITGMLGASLALITGEAAEESIAPAYRSLVEVHSAFAVATAWLFGVLAVLTLVAWIERDARRLIPSSVSRPWAILVRLEQFLLRSWLGVVLALIGVVLMMITGALGGAIVYGPDADPFVSLVTSMLVQ